MSVASLLATRLDRRMANVLLNQQFWCWGQDIRQPAGNLLLAFGFRRLRPPVGVLGSSCYRLSLAGGEVVLWGWGVLWSGASTGVFLPRRQFAPQGVRGSLAAPCWSPEGLPPLDPPTLVSQQTLALLAELLDWLAGYERWVLQVAGRDYRRACAGAAPGATLTLLPEQVPTLWEQLSCAAAVWARSRAPSRVAAPSL
ncbi:MAG: hypothetical protein KatS3mg061_2838 [Dehalococcoidia bacterium]|nr:MAG: hypothetical protein KatS3mg061_2838 [Dehalococcoidia bacterium]